MEDAYRLHLLALPPAYFIQPAWRISSTVRRPWVISSPVPTFSGHHSKRALEDLGHVVPTVWGQARELLGDRIAERRQPTVIDPLLLEPVVERMLGLREVPMIVR